MDLQTEQYLGAVGEHLAANGVPSRKAGEHLEEMADHLETTQRSGFDEYGAPQSVARELAMADGLATRSWIRLVVTALTILLLGLGLVLVLAGNKPAVIDGSDLGPLVFLAAVATFLASSAGAAHRDRLLGVVPGYDRTVLLIGIVVGSMLAMLVTSISIELLVGDRTIGVSSVRSWHAGLAIITGAALLLWWTRGDVFDRPQFRSGSALRSSDLTRRIRIKGESRLGLAEALPYATPVAVLALIVVSGRVEDPWSVIGLFLALAVGLGGLIWTQRLSRS